MHLVRVVTCLNFWFGPVSLMAAFQTAGRNLKVVTIGVVLFIAVAKRSVLNCIIKLKVATEEKDHTVPSVPFKHLWLYSLSCSVVTSLFEVQMLPFILLLFYYHLLFCINSVFKSMII